MRKGIFVTFRINQEIPSVKLIVFLTSTTGRVEKNKKIEPRNSINIEEI
jgi:Fe-S cluster assembly ATPase SufC